MSKLLVNISALVSCYYSENLIETRIINLKKQPCEIVLICQAGSAEHEVGMKYNCTIVLTPDIPTIYQAWNLGIKVAKGEYLTSANTDDIFYDGALAKMRAELEKTGAGHVTHYCHSQSKRRGR